MTRYRQKFLGHDLLVWQLPDGKWHVEISGSANIVSPRHYHTEAEAKWTAHLLAHWHLEDRKACGCPEQPAWVREEHGASDRQDSPAAKPT